MLEKKIINIRYFPSGDVKPVKSLYRVEKTIY